MGSFFAHSSIKPTNEDIPTRHTIKFGQNNNPLGVDMGNAVLGNIITCLLDLRLLNVYLCSLHCTSGFPYFLILLQVLMQLILIKFEILNGLL